MEYRILEINNLSANDLKNANLFTKMDAYVVLTLSGDTRLANQKFKTHVDRQGGNNPTWNFLVKFRIDQAAAEKNRLTLTFNIRCDRALGDKDVGTVVVPLKELYDDMAAADGGKLSSSTTTQMKSVTYQVRKPSGKPKGELHFYYKFGDTEKYPYADVEGSAVPVAYPVGTSNGNPPIPSPVLAVYQPPPPPPPAYAYPAQQYPGNVYGGYQPPPPPPPAYAYPAQQYPGNVYGGYPRPPPQPWYRYPPPPPAGYGYAPPQQPQNRNNLGMGLGAGLLGGVLGGLLIGDLVSDATGYDDGSFGDGWGF